MAKGEFDMLYLCAWGGGGAMIFFLINEHLLRGGQKQNPEMIRKAGGLPQNERKNKNIIIAHPLNNL